MKGIEGRYLWDGVWRMILAGFVMAAITYITLEQLAGIAALWQLILCGLAGGITYLVASIFLQIKEPRQLLAQVQRRLKTRK